MTHQFIKVAEVDKAIHRSNRASPGAIVVCAECGEVRHMYTDGEVYIALIGEKPCQNPKQ